MIDWSHMGEVSNAIEARAGTLLEFIGDEAVDGGAEICRTTEGMQQPFILTG